MEDLNDKITGDTLTAIEWNQVPAEIQNTIESVGLVLSAGDLSQLLKAVHLISRAASFGVDSGAADAYIVTTSDASGSTYSAGMKVEFLALNPNTGSSTINVDGLGVIDIKVDYGFSDDVVGGQINGLTTLIYDGASFCLYNTERFLPNQVALKGQDIGATVVSNLIQFGSAAIEVGDKLEPISIVGDIFELILGDPGNIMIRAVASGQVQLRFNGTNALLTQGTTTPPVTTSASVFDTAGATHDIGYNTLPPVPTAVGVDLDRTICGKQVNFTGGAGQSMLLVSDVNVRDGSTWFIANLGTSTLTISENGNGAMTFMDGGGSLATGNRTLAIAGVATVTKTGTSTYMVFGAGLS